MRFRLEHRRRTRITVGIADRPSAVLFVVDARIAGETFARVRSWLSPTSRLDQRQTLADGHVLEHHLHTFPAHYRGRGVGGDHRLAIALLVQLLDLRADLYTAPGRSSVAAHKTEIVEIGQTVGGHCEGRFRRGRLI